MNTLTKTVAAMALALVCSQVHAQVYKCKDGDGKTTYQQIPCSKTESEERVKIWAQPPQADIEAAKERMRAEEYAKAQEAYEQELLNAAQVGYQAPQAPPPMHQQKEPVPVASGSCPPGQVPLNASRSDPSRGWSSSKGYVPLRCGSTDRQASSRATRTGPGYTEPRQIFDQYGNLYLQPPGSGFATDTKTGKQCVISGNVIVSCN